MKSRNLGMLNYIKKSNRRNLIEKTGMVLLFWGFVVFMEYCFIEPEIEHRM